MLYLYICVNKFSVKFYKIKFILGYNLKQDEKRD